MEITADATTLMNQAPKAADNYLGAAVRAIDSQFHEGYAQNHPELVAAFIEVCAKDFATAVLAQTIQEAAAQIADSLASED